jgi:hypothetical protein
MNILQTTALVALSAIALQSCKKDPVNPSSNPADPTNQGRSAFKVRMTDAPANFSGLFVEIVSVDAYLENSGWVNLSNEAQMVSVLDLTNGAETTLAYDADVDAGVYSKLKITFGNENSLVLNGALGGSAIDLNFGSQASQEVIIEIDEQAAAGGQAEVLIDFNVAESVDELGGLFQLNPDISVIGDEETGISGDVNGALQASVVLSDGQHSYSTFISASGEFLMRGVESGSYSLSIHAVNQQTGQLQERNFSNVVIVDGQIKSMGTIQL